MNSMCPMKQIAIIVGAFLCLVGFLMLALPAKAQGINRLCYSGSLTDANCVPATTVTPYPVTAQISGGSSTISGTITSAQGTSPWVVSGPVTATVSPSAASSASQLPSATSSITGARIFKTSGGNLYGLQVTSSTTAGYVLLFDATSVPADGAVTPIKCYKLGGNATVVVSWLPGPVLRFVNGLVAVYSTTGCFSKAVENTAFISGEVE